MSQFSEHDVLLKMLLVGSSGVGKSSFMNRVVRDQRPSDQFLPTIGIDFAIKLLKLNGIQYKLQIWDTAGQERFRTITNAYYRGGEGVLLVYDVSDRASFEHISRWYEEAKSSCQNGVSFVLIGNKADVAEERRQVTCDEGVALAKRLGWLPFMECSCETGSNIERAMNLMIHEVQRSISRELLQRGSHGYVSAPSDTRDEEDDVDLCTIM